MKAHNSLIEKDLFSFHEAKAAGLRSEDLRTLVNEGRVKRITRGFYRNANAPWADTALIEIAARAPRATICLTSALARYDLSDATPSRLDIALPRNTRRPKVATTVQWHSFDAATFDIGRNVEKIDGTDMTIGIYSPERCIIDAFRLRGYVGYEIAREALANWLRRPGSRPATLISLARTIPRSEGPLRAALEFLA